MKWNWFCPLPPAKTGIADYLVKILPSVAEHAELVFWTHQEEWDSIITHYGTVCRYDPRDPPWEDLNDADLNIYHIGNQPDFHGAIWQMARSAPGLVVLHDRSLHHLFGALYRDVWKTLPAYLSVMRQYHGEASLEHAIAFFDHGVSTMFMAEHYPLTWHALENALGVVVHSHEMFSEINQAGRLPVAYLPLSYTSQKNVRRRNRSPKNEFVHLVMFGFLGQNRRLEQVLQAIAGFPRRERIRLDVCGEIYHENIPALLRDLGLTENVRTRGFVSDEELDEILARSDLALNLRYPSMGEASLSQLRIWEHSLPSLVTKVGWYATLPEDSVCFVRPDHEIEDIREHLNGLLDDPERFERIGNRGRAQLEADHLPADYAEALQRFATSVADSGSFRIDHWVERVGDIVKDWLTEDADPAILTNVSREILALGRQE